MQYRLPTYLSLPTERFGTRLANSAKCIITQVMLPASEEGGEKGAVLRVDVAAKLTDSEEEDIKRQVTVHHKFSSRVSGVTSPDGGCFTYLVSIVYCAPQKSRGCCVEIGTPESCL